MVSRDVMLPIFGGGRRDLGPGGQAILRELPLRPAAGDHEVPFAAAAALAQLGEAAMAP